MRTLVDVVCLHDREGNVKPLWILWEDGTRYSVDRITQVKRAASLKNGGAGLRYTCRIHSAWRYLFYADDRWFVEKCDSM